MVTQDSRSGQNSFPMIKPLESSSFLQYESKYGIDLPTFAMIRCQRRGSLIALTISSGIPDSWRRSIIRRTKNGRQASLVPPRLSRQDSGTDDVSRAWHSHANKKGYKLDERYPSKPSEHEPALAEAWTT